MVVNRCLDSPTYAKRDLVLRRFPRVPGSLAEGSSTILFSQKSPTDIPPAMRCFFPSKQGMAVPGLTPSEKDMQK